MLTSIKMPNYVSFLPSLYSLGRFLKRNSSCGKIVVSESGIKTPEDLRFLRDCGAKAFLIGSIIMLTENIEAKVKEFVKA